MKLDVCCGIWLPPSGIVTVVPLLLVTNMLHYFALEGLGLHRGLVHNPIILGKAYWPNLQCKHSVGVACSGLRLPTLVFLNKPMWYVWNAVRWIFVVSRFLKIVWVSAEEILVQRFHCSPVLTAPLSFVFGCSVSKVSWQGVSEVDVTNRKKVSSKSFFFFLFF